MSTKRLFHGATVSRIRRVIGGTTIAAVLGGTMGCLGADDGEGARATDAVSEPSSSSSAEILDEVTNATETSDALRELAEDLERAGLTPELIGTGPSECEPYAHAVLSCGKAGVEASFERGADCWLNPCYGTLHAVPEGSVLLVDAERRPVPGQVLHDDHTISFTATDPLDPQQNYALIVAGGQIRNSEGRPAVVDNGRLDEEAGTYWFCFDPRERPSSRNGELNHNCQ